MSERRRKRDTALVVRCSSCNETIDSLRGKGADGRMIADYEGLVQVIPCYCARCASQRLAA